MEIFAKEKIILLELLALLSPESSNNTRRSWIEQRRVFVNEKLALRANQSVEKGEHVRVEHAKKFLPGGVQIVYEDRELVVIDKPAGLLTVALDNKLSQTAHGFLKKRFYSQVVYPIHRLDRETSGLLVFAYTSSTREALKKQLELRAISREYKALVHGNPGLENSGKGTWRCHLRENQQLEVYVCPASMGKEAVTHFDVVEQRGDFTLLHLKLETGRKHQIRVHASHMGHPIVGDDKYGKGGERKKRLCLHAERLTFFHPIQQKEVSFYSPCPF